MNLKEMNLRELDLKKFNKIYRRMFGLVAVVLALLLMLAVFIVFLLLRDSVFSVDSLSEHTALVVLIIVVCLLIISQGLTMFWLRRISKPSADISSVLARVAQGDFDVRVDTSGFKNEMLHLGNEINRMIEELGSIEVMRSDFVSNVSHEFRAPLSSIQGCVTLLSSPNISQEQQDEYFALLKEATRQLSSLVDNVLKLSRLESQNMPAQPKRFSLDEQLRRSVLLFEQQWSQKELELELELPECSYAGNEELLGQVWTNLIGNAVKFTGQGGKIGVRLEDKDPGYVAVTVYDTGEGMTEEVKKHIFEKFYQGDSSHRASGNGLGLALVKSICQLTGSRISVESEPGKGSAFTVKLPKGTETK